VSGHDHAPAYSGDDPIYKRALWAVIAINGIMFVVELNAGITAKSMALQADALDFLVDSVT
jgi:Co/Zn/Cd efflux system component